MWIINEGKEEYFAQGVNTKTLTLIDIDLDKFSIKFGPSAIDLEIDNKIYTKVPIKEICRIYDSLENFKYMEIEEIEEYFMEQMTEYIEKTKENDEQVKGITTEDFLKEYGFETLEKALEDGDIHVERTEQDMKLWFLDDLSTSEVLDILEGKVNTNYDTWEYLKDRNLWVFVYC